MNENAQPSISLKDGDSIPQLGLGCYKVTPQEMADAFLWATQAGCRHFDTAAYYGNEESVGKALRACGLPRESVFLTTKIWPRDYHAPQRAVEDSLRRLDCDYVDAFLLHWPGTDEAARYRAWEELLRRQQQGYIKSVGVSNFMIPQLEALIKEFGVVPVINQVELHPWYPQRRLSDYCRQQGIAVTAWGPIFRGHIGEAPLMALLGEKYGKSPVQVTLRWHIQRGHVAIPKSVHKERIEQNMDVFDFSLEPEDMAQIDALECGRHFCNDPYTYNG